MNRQTKKAEAREKVRQAGSGPKQITLIFLLCCLASVVLRLLLDKIGDKTTDGYISQSIAGGGQSLLLRYGLTLLLQALLVLLRAGYVSMGQVLRRGEEVSTWTLLDGFFCAGRVILWDILQGLIIVLWSYALSMLAIFCFAMLLPSTGPTMLAFYGYVMLVMLLISYRYRGALYLLMEDRSLSPWRAIRTAAAMNKGHWWELFRLDLSFLPLALLCCLTCGILGIWKFPYIMTTYAQVYEELYTDYQRRWGQAEQIQERFRTGK